MGLKARPIRWAEPAEASLSRLLAFIATENPAAARELLARVSASLAQAARHPEMFRFIPELGHGYREIVSVRPFRLIYQLAGNEVRVIAVLRAEQDFDPARFIETP